MVVINQDNTFAPPAPTKVLGQVLTLVNAPVMVPLGVVLYPGDELWIQCGVGVANSFLSTLYGREFINR
jgi:hypothetical protein